MVVSLNSDILKFLQNDFKDLKIRIERIFRVMCAFDGVKAPSGRIADLEFTTNYVNFSFPKNSENLAWRYQVPLKYLDMTMDEIVDDYASKSHNVVPRPDVSEIMKNRDVYEGKSKGVARYETS
jgi:hypothetical protein